MMSVSYFQMAQKNGDRPQTKAECLQSKGKQCSLNSSFKFSVNAGISKINPWGKLIALMLQDTWVGIMGLH